jgi:hypothetical protein
VLTIAFHTTGLMDPSEHNWRLEVTSNDTENDPGQGGSPIDIHLQVFAASEWHDCVEDTLSTGLHRMQISSCLEMGGQGTPGTGFYDYVNGTEWLTSGSPVVTRPIGSDLLAYFNAHMTPLDRSRERNQSFRAQSELIVHRDTTITVGDSNYVVDLARGSASTTDTTIGIDYDVIYPKSTGQRGAIWKLTISTLTGSTVEDVSLGVLADLDVIEPGQGGAVWLNAGAGAESRGWIGAQAGRFDTAIGFVPLNSWMALFYLSPTSACDVRSAAAAQVIGNGFYLHPWGTYPADSVYSLFDRFGTDGSWGTNIHIDTGQEFADVSALLVNASRIDLVPGAPVDWGFGIAVSDVSEADLEATITRLRSTFAPDCCLGVIAGDVNESGGVTSTDIVWLVNYVFKGGTEPLPCAANGDADCTGHITSADIIYLVHYVFKGGEPPCDACTDSPLNCP